jgi:5'-nucleotidase
MWQCSQKRIYLFKSIPIKESAVKSRRQFIRNTGLTVASFLAAHPVLFARQPDRAIKQLTILHTNDVHSRIEPFAMDGSANAGKGGVAARAAIIEKIRKESEQVLLLDSGDIFQGTPYFNIFKGEPEIKAMQFMGYDACTMGNHDFDAGLDNFRNQLKAHAKFPLIISNYDFTNTVMEGEYLPYKIIRKGNLDIGITGVGIELQGLVPDSLFGNTKYLDPVVSANKAAHYLKKEKGCDLVICLSHLGDKYSDNKVSDEVLAKQSENIDLILGGHTHRFFDAPRIYQNKNGKTVVVNQVGWGGLKLGRLDYSFSAAKPKNLDNNQSISIGKKEGE